MRNQYFNKPPKLRELAHASGKSYWAMRRLVNAGVAPICKFPDGDCVQTEWANRYYQDGLTADELYRYKTAMKKFREGTS